MPGPPFQVFGATYYVGTCGIASILIASDDGHILIDSGTENAADLILANVRTLGFELADIRYILHSHEHYDHVGSHARLKQLIDAEKADGTSVAIVASPEAAEVLRRGNVGENDPQFGIHEDMLPVTADRIVTQGATISAGQTVLTAHETPGHTPGALSWTWTACSLPSEPPACTRIAYVDSLSPVSADSYRFSDHPDTIAAFRQSIARVRAMPCDIILTPHPSASGLVKDIRGGSFGAPGGCDRYASGLQTRVDTRLAEEQNRGD